MIRIEGLSKKYGDQVVLDGITAGFPAGVHGIVGENGAGKTTLFRCMAGLERFEGMVISPFERLKDHLGFLPTEPFFFSRITGREYLRLLCQARRQAIPDPDESNIFDLPLDRYASAYSTGMKKKLALMALLLQRNDFFILDEPFNGVDIHSNMIITGIIRRLKDLGKTVLISSHIFSTLSDTCNEIHLLSGGRISRSAGKADFSQLEEELNRYSIGNMIDKLNLT